MMRMTTLLLAILALAILGGCALFFEPETDPRSSTDPQPWNSVPGWEQQMGPGIQR
jgi:hypothetical protein